MKKLQLKDLQKKRISNDVAKNVKAGLGTMPFYKLKYTNVSYISWGEVDIQEDNFTGPGTQNSSNNKFNWRR